MYGGGRKSVEMPWLDYGTTAMPDSQELIMWWAQYLWNADGNYRTAFQRVGSHFITEIEFPELETEEENEYKDLFLKHLNYRRELQSCSDDYLAYGNVFCSIYLPFQRFLRCRNTKCGYEQPVNRAPYKIAFEHTGVVWNRKRPCPLCGNNKPFQCQDRPDPDISRLKLKRYSPFEIQMAMNPFSLRKDIYWKIPAEDRRDILSGADIYIHDTPMDVLEAVAKNADFLFNEEMIFHLDETIISGMRTRGWGIPRAISNFRLAWLMQVVNRADQAIALDYTLGMRVMSPGMPAGSSQDPMQVQGMGEFVAHTKKMIAAHRENPATYHTAPYPLNYQFMGGEGENLIPADKLKFRQQEFLNANGIPLEYHQMTLSTQAAPMALQLFEAAWQAIPSLYNSILNWIIKASARYFGLDETAVGLKATTVAFDEARKQMVLQLMSAQQVSPETALAAIGVDAKKEVDKTFKHQKYVAQKQQEADEEAEKQQEMGAVKQIAGAPSATQLLQGAAQTAATGASGQAGGGGAGGAPQGGNAAANTLSGMSDQAEQMAGQLVSMPEYDRKQQLKSLREGNKDLHSLVMSAMDKIRGQAASQGQQQLLAPQPGGGAPPAQ